MKTTTKTAMQALNSALDKHLAALTDAELEQFLKTAKDTARQFRAARKAADRKLEDQKKYILGGLVGWLVENNKIQKADLNTWMDQYITRAKDRYLFGLPPLSDQPVIKNGVIEPSYSVMDAEEPQEAEIL